MADIKYGAQYGTAYQHLYAGSCQYGPWHYFTASDTRRRRGVMVCPRCAGELYSVRVTFAIVPWRADGRYRLADAVATYSRERMADADASRRYAADERSPYVVRSFSAS